MKNTLTEDDFKNFVHVHTHSHYSLLDGLGKIPELVAFAKEQGMKALALTDHGVMYGAIEFYKECLENDIKPIIGFEAYVAQRTRHDKTTKEDRSPNHLILLAQNEEGYQNLMKLTTIAHVEGFYYKPQIDMETLRKHSNGLIASGACLNGAVPRSILKNIASNDLAPVKKVVEKYLDIFGTSRFFLEVQNNPTIKKQQDVNKGIFQLAKEMKLNVISTGDIHYVREDDADTHDILICVQTNRTIDEEDRMSYLPEKFYMEHPKELSKAFPDHPEVITNTKKIIDSCDLKIELGKSKLPSFEIPQEFDEASYLKKLCDEGLKFRYGTSDLSQLDKQIAERLEFELATINKMGFAGYFLITQDYIRWAKDQDIVVGPGRGSAAGSLVTYLLQITDIDPLKYGLLFERFLNPDRISMPDIDTDFADDRRDEVIEYVAKKYGHDHVAQIITFGTMAARAAVRDCGRALGFPYSFCDMIAKLIPMLTSLEHALDEVTELKDQYNTDPQVKRLLDNAKKLEGVARHASTHACAVVITPKPLSHYTPCQYASAEDQSLITQYEMHAIEDLGLLKMDFLGLKNLTIIQNSINLIQEINDVNIDRDAIPFNDKTTYELFQRGHTTGVFQFESSGMKRWLKQLKPTEFEDIIAMVALYRPGPMEFIPDYIAGKHGTKEVTYLHPLLEPILKQTYGVAIYQEQIMQISRAIALFTPGEADTLRKGMGKKIKEVVDKMHDQFIVGAQKNNVDKACAQEIWEYIVPFASYGFNRSHAACYALIGYQTAYLKAHYPAEFMAALLTSDQGNTDRVAIEVDECRQMDIEVLPPDINESVKDFTVVNPQDKKRTIRFGLGAIKNVGEGIIEEVIAERNENGKFENIDDILSRVHSKDLNRKSLESLTKCGALDSLCERNQILENIETILAYSKELQKVKESGQSNLFGDALQASIAPQLKLTEAPKASKEHRLEWEKTLLGLYISDHPLKEYVPYLRIYAASMQEITTDIVDYQVKIGGIVSAIRKIVTKKGDPMAFVTIEDMQEKIEAIVFPKLFEKNPNLWEEGKIVMISGTVNNKDGTLKILANTADSISKNELDQELPKEPTDDRIMPPKSTSKRSIQQSYKNNNNSNKKNNTNTETANPLNKPRALFIRITEETTKQVLKDLSQLFTQAPKGLIPIYLVAIQEQSNSRQKIRTPYTIEITQDLLEQLGNIIGRENVRTI